MGSIDESALQNLNLVINLTKHIHVKANAGGDDVDSDEYSRYFPSFMWIVRDFTLQLVDEDEENINSNQYLEKALEEQKGFSDKIEEKNRIRRLLKSFFKERQCFTMIRPVTNEEALQNLEQMNENGFRNEFLDQVVQLRKKVTHCVKPKMLNGKQLTPLMFISLAENYVTAINQGAVPNIENAWTYICQNESKKSLDNALIHFDDFLNDSVIHKLPMEEHELRELYKEARDECKEIFTKACVGEVIKEHMDELKYMLDMKFNKILTENERECYNSCSQFLDMEYSEIENKLKSDEYHDFYDYENDLQNFKQYYQTEAPPGPTRIESLLSFLNERLVESIDYFIKKLTNQLELEHQLSEEQIKSLKTQIEDLKKLRAQDRDETDQKLKQLSFELAQVKASNKSLEECRQTEQETFAKEKKELKDKLKREKADNERKLEESRKKEEDARKKENETKRQYMTEKNDYVKEMALLNQKLEHYEKNLQDQKAREENIKQEMEEQRNTQLQSTRTRIQEYENEISGLTQENERFKEHVQELEEHIDKQYKEHQARVEELEASIAENADNGCNSEEYLQLKETLEQFEQNKNEEIEELTASFKEVQDQLSEKVIEAEDKAKKWHQDLLNETNNFEKDKAIFDQKISFMQDQIDSLTQKLEAKEKENESMFELLGKNQNESDEITEIQLELQKVKADAEQEKELLETQIENMKAEYEARETDLHEKIMELEKQSTLTESEFETTIEELNDQISKLQEEKEQLESSQGNSTARSKFFDEFESKKDETIKKLEQEIDDIKAQFQKDSEERMKNNERSLNSLKNAFNEEKKTLENKIANMKQQHQEQMNELNEEKEQIIWERDSELNEYNNQFIIMNQKTTDLEEQLKEKTKQVEEQSEKYQKRFDTHLEQLSEEKKSLHEQVDKYKNDLMMKQMEVTELKNKSSKSSEDMQQKVIELQDDKTALEEQKENLEYEIKTLNDKLNKIEYERQQDAFQHDNKLSLIQQQLQFKEQNLAELREKYDKEVDQLKNDSKKNSEMIIKDLEQRIVQVTAEKDKAKEKAEKLVANFKTVEGELNSKLSELEKDNAILNEKYSHLVKKQAEDKENYEAKILDLQSNSQNASSDLVKKNENLQKEVEAYQDKIATLESQYYELNTKYDKETALLNGKVDHFKTAAEQVKKDLKEDRDRFKQTIQSLTKKGEIERNRETNGQTQFYQSMEMRYKEQIKDLKKEQSEAVKSYQSTIKEYKEELKGLKEQLSIEQSDKRNSNKSLKLELTKHKQNEERLQSDMQAIKAESEEKLISLQKKLDEERTNNRSKIDELEAKFKEKEATAEQLLVTIELNNSKNSIQLEQVKEKLNEYQTKYEKYKKLYDGNQRGYDKTKAGQRPFRKGGFGVERSSSNFGKTGLRPSYNDFTKDRSSVGSSINGSQKENTSVQRVSMNPKFINDKFGNKTTNFDDLSTNKNSAPLGRNMLQHHSNTSQFESKDEDDEVNE